MTGAARARAPTARARENRFMTSLLSPTDAAQVLQGAGGLASRIAGGRAFAFDVEQGILDAPCSFVYGREVENAVAAGRSLACLVDVFQMETGDALSMLVDDLDWIRTAGRDPRDVELEADRRIGVRDHDIEGTLSVDGFEVRRVRVIRELHAGGSRDVIRLVHCVAHASQAVERLHIGGTG